MDEFKDVVVVGAGLSGLIAGRELKRAGLDVVVVEASDRYGGRVMSETTVLGSRLDIGGQWIGHDHHRLTALVDELGATSFVMHTSRVPTIVENGARVRALSRTVLGAAASLLGLNLVRWTRNPARWASRSVADWMGKVPKPSRRLLEVAVAASWTADPVKVSVPTMMSMIRGQGGLTTMLSTKGGAQDSLITEGVGLLLDQLADELGDALKTGTRVSEIVRDTEGAVIRTGSDEVRARRVIIAVPPPTAARIAHDPPLPQSRADLERTTFMGSVYKAIAVYPEPFWRTSASGEMIFLDQPGCATFDTSAPGGPGHVCFLVGGPDAELLDPLSTAERRHLLLSRMAPFLGPDILEPVGWHEKSWHLDPDVGGGYLALPALDSPATNLPMAAEPIGPLHWAGTETASDHPGYLDGAIEAGLRAAAEVTEALSPHRTR